MFVFFHIKSTRNIQSCNFKEIAVIIFEIKLAHHYFYVSSDIICHHYFKSSMLLIQNSLSLKIPTLCSSSYMQKTIQNFQRSNFKRIPVILFGIKLAHHYFKSSVILLQNFWKISNKISTSFMQKVLEAYNHQILSKFLLFYLK